MTLRSSRESCWGSFVLCITVLFSYSDALVTNTIRSSCEEHLRAGLSTSGTYMVKPNVDTYEVYCDQQSDGGGWMLVAIANDGNVISTENNGADSSDPFVGNYVKGVYGTGHGSRFDCGTSIDGMCISGTAT